MRAHKSASKRPPSTVRGSLLIGITIWAVLSAIVFVAMRNYPELPGQKVPKAWMISVFLIFLVAAGFWANIYFGFLHHRVRILAARILGTRSRSGSLSDSNLLATAGPDDWVAAEGAPMHKILLFTVCEWSAIVVGIVIPVGGLLTAGAVLTGYLSEQLTGREILGWFGL